MKASMCYAYSDIFILWKAVTFSKWVSALYVTSGPPGCYEKAVYLIIQGTYVLCHA